MSTLPIIGSGTLSTSDDFIEDSYGRRPLLLWAKEATVGNVPSAITAFVEAQRQYAEIAQEAGIELSELKTSPLQFSVPVSGSAEHYLYGKIEDVSQRRQL